MYVIFMLLLLYKHSKYLIIWVHELHVVKVFFSWYLFPRMAIWIQRLLIFLDDAKKCTLLYQFFFLLFFLKFNNCRIYSWKNQRGCIFQSHKISWFWLFNLQQKSKEMNTYILRKMQNNSLSFIKLNDEKQGSSEVQWSKYGVHQVLRRRGGAKIEGWSLLNWNGRAWEIYHIFLIKKGFFPEMK